MRNTPFVREKSALAPNPEVFADMYLARLSGTNSHAHIYAAHPTIFYSHALSIRFVLRRYCFCCINFLFEVTSLDLVSLITAIKRVALISGVLWG